MRKQIKYHLVGLLSLIFLFPNFGCGQDTPEHTLKCDHILLFASNYALKDSLDRFFTPAERLTTKHISQGTIGYYYLFYNTYIELLFIQDTVNVKVNKNNFGSDYLSRWKQNEKNCPFGFGMLMTPWDTSTNNVNYHKYENRDAPDGEYYLMSKYNTDLSEPFIFVSQPNHAYKSLASLEDLDERPEEIRDILKKYLTHSKDLKKIYQIIYSYSVESKIEGNIKILQESTIIDVVRSNSTSLTLVFDNGRNEEKEFMLNDKIKLIIKY